MNNTFTDCGLQIIESTIDYYLSYIVDNNWVNGKQLGFYTNLDSAIIDEPVYGQLILVNCTNVTVRDQILADTSVGMFLHSCTFSVINNNTCNNNYRGIYLHSSASSTVANNTCNNSNHGIDLFYSDFCVVTYNLLQENYEYGVYLRYDSDNNTIHHNTFVDNNLGGMSQACDEGANNTWYDVVSLEGNFWSDWSGVGSYSIDGPLGNSDLYP